MMNKKGDGGAAWRGWPGLAGARALPSTVLDIYIINNEITHLVPGHKRNSFRVSRLGQSQCGWEARSQMKHEPIILGDESPYFQ